MEAFFRTHRYLIEHTNAPVRRTLMDEIDWSDRMIGIKGTRGIADFAGNFYNHGGRVLLIDQVFKQPDWSKELRKCYDLYPNLQDKVLAWE